MTQIKFRIHFVISLQTLGQVVQMLSLCPKPILNAYLNKNPGKSINSMFLNHTDAIEISQIIKSLQPKKSCVSDKFSLCFLKQIGEKVSIPAVNLKTSL